MLFEGSPRVKRVVASLEARLSSESTLCDMVKKVLHRRSCQGADLTLVPLRFFQDLVECGIFYAAIYPEEVGCGVNQSFILGRPNILSQLLPDYERFSAVIRVIDVDETVLMADIVSQRVCCLRKP